MIEPQFIQKANEADLLALIGTTTQLKRVAASEGGEYAGPCPMCGGKDRFHVQPARGRWLCRRCTGKWSDAIALHRALYHSTFEEAVRALCGGDLAYTQIGAAHQPLVRAAAETSEPSEPPTPAWQNRAQDVIVEAQRNLWANTPEAAEVRRWLSRQRGLSRSLLKLWQVGWLPQPRREPATWWGWPDTDEPVYLSAGVLLPCEVDHTIWYLKVRRLEPGADPKYVHVRGSRPALYLADTITPATRVVALTEGEFDALLLWQALHARRWPQPVGVATFGSATNRLREPWAGRLEGKKLLTLYDSDKAGQAATAWWKAHYPAVLAIPIPELKKGLKVKDLTDYWKAGGKVAELIALAL
jgi:DNA primase